MLTSGDGRGSAGSRLFSIALLRGALTHEFPIDSREDSLLALAESRVSFSRLRHRHDRLRIRLVTRRIAEVPGKGVRREPQYPLQLGDPPRLRHGLACKPLGDRRLGDTQRSGKTSLRQAALGTGALERPHEVLPLIGRLHALVLSAGQSYLNRMPDQPITGRFPAFDNFVAVRRPLVTYTHLCKSGKARSGSRRLPQGEAS